MKNFLLLYFTLTAYISYGQESDFIVYDKTNNEIVSYANVIAEDLSTSKVYYATSNLNGEVKLDFAGKAKLTVSFVGYKTFVKNVDLSSLKKIELEQDLFYLDQVIVTGQNKPMLKDSSIYDVRVFDSKVIEQRGAVNLGDVLKAEPTIQINQSGAFGSNIRMLGLGGENVKIMIDGVPIIGRLDGNLDLSQITMENVDHIEVVEGPMSVVYGSNALAGTVNIITKNNRWNKFKTSIGTYIETPGTINANALATGKIGRHVLTGTFARNYFHGISIDNSRESLWKGSTQYNGEMRYAYNGNSYQFRLSGKYFDEFMKDKGEVNNLTYFATDVNYMTKRYGVNAFFDIDHNEKMQSNFQSSISYYNRIAQTVRKDMTSLEEKTSTADTTGFVNYMFRGTFNHKINSSISYQTGVDINSEVGTAQRIQGGEQSIGDYAIFITGKHELMKGFFIQPGLRYAYNTSFNTPLLPSINLMYDFAEGWQIRASYARGFRAPTLKELYLDYPHAGLDVKGNPNLKPETSNTFNGSLSYKRRHSDDYLYKMELKGYYNDIYDMIDFQADPNNPDIWSNYNIGNIETLGLISNFSFDYSTLLSFNISHTLAGVTSLEYMEDKTSNDKYIYTNYILTALTYNFQNINLSTRLEYSYNGEEPSRFIDENTLVEPMVESFQMLNFSMSKSFWNRNINLTLGVKNILDHQNLQMRNASAGGGHSASGSSRLLSWGRSYFVKLNFNINYIK
jgi:outer membrane receptor for ferrienterochelin and colicins